MLNDFRNAVVIDAYKTNFMESFAKAKRLTRWFFLRSSLQSGIVPTAQLFILIDLPTFCTYGTIEIVLIGYLRILSEAIDVKPSASN